MTGKTVRIGDWTHQKLKEIKKREDHTTLDSAIRMLVIKYERNRERSGEE